MAIQEHKVKVTFEGDTKKMESDLDKSLKKTRTLDIKANVQDFWKGMQKGALQTLGIGGDDKKGGAGAAGMSMMAGLGEAGGALAVAGLIGVALKQLVDLLRDLLKELAKHSGILSGTMKILENSFTLFIKPFADFLGYLLRPLAILLLRLAIAWYKNIEGPMTTLGQAAGNAQVNPLATKSIGIGSMFPALGITGVPPEFWSKLWDGLKKDWNDKVVPFFHKTWTDIVTFWNKLGPQIQTEIDNIKTWWANNITKPVEDDITKIKLWWEKNITTPIENDIASIKKWWTDNITTPIQTFITNVKTWWADNITTPINNFFTNAKNWIKDNIETPFQNAINKIQGWINKILSSIGLGSSTKHQLGGLVLSPQTVSVAEREPEYIIPMSKMGQMNGGMNYSPNITINANISKDYDVKQLGEKLAKYSREAMARRSSYYNR